MTLAELAVAFQGKLSPWTEIRLCFNGRTWWVQVLSLGVVMHSTPAGVDDIEKAIADAIASTEEGE